MSTKKVSVLEVSIWIVLTLIVLLALSPYIVGFKVKSDYANLIDSMSKASQLDLHIKQYSQGFYSSEATLELILPHSNESITFKEEIIHGPVYLGLINQDKSPLIAAVVSGKLETENIHIKNIADILSGSESILYQHLIDFNGDVDSQIYVPAISSSYQGEHDRVTFQSSAVIFKQSLLASDGMLKGEIKLPMLKTTESAQDFTVEKFTLSFSGKVGANQLIVGDTVASIVSLSINSVDEQFAVRDLTVRSATSDAGALINSGTQLSIREVLASNHKFGPLKLNLSLNGLNANSLLQLQQTQKTVEDKLSQGTDPEQVNAMMTGQVMAILPDLIKQAQIKINPLSIHSELGRLEADMDFKLEAINADSSVDPVSLLNAINLELNMTIDEQLLKQMVAWNLENVESDTETKAQVAPKKATDYSTSTKVNDNIKAMLDVNWLVKHDGQFITKINMHQGSLLINDRPLDPMQQIISSVGANGALSTH